MYCLSYIVVICQQVDVMDKETTGDYNAMPSSNSVSFNDMLEDVGVWSPSSTDESPVIVITFPDVDYVEKVTIAGEGIINAVVVVYDETNNNTKKEIRLVSE